ncbi:MAG: CoA pyrophosphatase [Thermotogae bacterium]|nr:CoA pyrophosphatase [Thermotogota bacterium]
MPKVKRAVVLILVKDLEVLLIRRSLHLNQHGGEIGFPGGMVDPGESPLRALYREVEEELSLKPSDYFIVGELSPVKTLVSNTKIYPYVALLRGNPKIVPNPSEIEAFGFVKLRKLRSLLYEDTVQTDLGAVWGATARIVRNLFREGRSFMPEVEKVLKLGD